LVDSFTVFFFIVLLYYFIFYSLILLWFIFSEYRRQTCREGFKCDKYIVQ